MKYFLILDIETAGDGTFRPPKQTPIQISFELIDEEFNLICSYSAFIKGIEEINWLDCPWSVEHINEHGVDFNEALNKLYETIDDEVFNDLSKDTSLYIVGHNIDFDVGCLTWFSGDNRLSTYKTICTMKKGTNICKIPQKGKDHQDMPNRFKWPKLIELANFCGVENAEHKFHDSMYDVEITRKCFIHLKKNNLI